MKRIPTEKIDTHKVYANEPHVLPNRPKLNDSITPPEFIGGVKHFRDTLYSELIKIYQQRDIKDYSRIHFTMKVDESGIASGLKVIHLTKNIENNFVKIYPLLLNKLKIWKPAINKNNI